MYISWEDLKRVYLKQKDLIGRLLLYGMIVSFLYFLITPVVYQARATFKQALASTQEGFDFRNLLRNFSAKTAEGSAVPLMLSRTVLGAAAQELGLQLEISSQGRVWKTVRDNLFAEWGKKPPDRDEFAFQSTVYSGEETGRFYLKFLSKSRFELLDHNKKFLSEGATQQPLSWDTLQFTLMNTPSSLQLGKLYLLTCSPLEPTCTKLRRRLLVKPLKDDRAILTISFKDQNRQRAALVVNTVMTKYEELLTLQNQEIISAQLNYLEKRQHELATKLDQEIHEHTQALEQTLASQGFLTSEEGISSLLEPLHDLRKRLHEIDVEMAGLNSKTDSIKGSKLLHQFRESVIASIQELDSVDFSAVTLPSCRTLYQSYSHQFDDLHAQMKQIVYFQDHLHEPNFEIATLCNVLSDSVTQQLVQKSAELESRLCDQINHSSREHDRLKETLATQKRYLNAHLAQTLQLGKIRITLLEEKLRSLRSVMRHLLQQEKTILENKMHELKGHFHNIPALWQLDKRLKFRAELTKGMMEGLTQITESKTLSQHLYQVESRPLDTAMTPFHPLPPQLIFKTALVGTGIFIAAYLFFLIQAFFRGLPASLATLRLMGATTAGLIAEEGSLRNIAFFLLEQKPTTVALVSEQELSCCFRLAKILAFQHHKTLFIDCNFNAPGLWQYLQEPASQLPIRHEEDYDVVSAGEATSHGMDILASARFRGVLADLSSRYDFIFLLKQAPLASLEALQLLSLARAAVIITSEESPATLRPYLQWSRQKETICALFAQHATAV
jgi:uncharacterized protein involved in exopolysaccharide biosynthesis